MTLALRSTRAVTPTVRIPSRTLEYRDPSAATAALQFSSPGHPQVSEWDATAAVKLAYLSNVFVYRCVEVCAKRFGALPFRMGADPEKPNDYDTKHPLAIRLGPAPGGPAPKISARQLWAWALAQRLVTGKLAWEIEYGAKNLPVAFWPLASSSLEAIPSKGGTDYFTGFTYGRASERRTLTKDQVFYHWSPSLTDWRQPESVLQAARLDVSVAVMQDRYDFAFLRNDARPASVVVHQAFAERDERDSWREHFLGEHMGPDNAGKVGFVEVDAEEGAPVTGMIDIKTLGLSQRDAEFINRYSAKVRAITVAFGTPLSVLGDSSGRTFSNADAEERFFWSITMSSLISEMEDAVNNSLAPLYPGSLVGWFDLRKIKALEPVKKPPIFDVVKAVEAGIISKDEARDAMLELSPIEDGSGAVPQVVQPVGLPTPQPALPPAVPPVVQSKAAAAPIPELREVGLPPTPTSPAPVSHEQRRAIIYRSVSRSVKALERVWERQWRAMFRRQQAATLKRLEGRRGRSALEKRNVNPDDVFDAEFWATESQDLAGGLYDAAFAMGGARVADLFGLDFNMQAAFVQKAIQARANKLAGQVTDTTYGAIKDTLAEGVKLGESIPDLAARIRDVFSVADSARATVIARTETISAYNQAGHDVAVELGADVVGGQEWISTLDDRTRDDHADADGQVVGLDETFTVGGEELAYPGDPAGSPENTIQCRCTTGLLTVDEAAQRAKRRIGIRAAERHLARVQLGRAKPKEVA